MLSCRQVSHSFFFDNEEIPILKNLNFNFESGESYAITGSSGSGKSTLLNVLSGLLKPESGDVKFNEMDLYAKSDDTLSSWRLNQTGYIYQDFRLLPRLTAEENVAISLKLQGEKHSVALKKAREILLKMNLKNREKHYPGNLSGGEQQRVALARAFVSHKNIIFADEPTGNLDVHSANKVMDSLLELNQNEKTTLILVTHDSAIANRMNVRLKMSEGSLILE